MYIYLQKANKERHVSIQPIFYLKRWKGYVLNDKLSLRESATHARTYSRVEPVLVEIVNIISCERCRETERGGPCRPIATEVNRDSGSTHGRVSFLGYLPQTEGVTPTHLLIAYSSDNIGHWNTEFANSIPDSPSFSSYPARSSRPHAMFAYVNLYWTCAIYIIYVYIAMKRKIKNLIWFNSTYCHLFRRGSY